MTLYWRTMLLGLLALRASGQTNGSFGISLDGESVSVAAGASAKIPLKVTAGSAGYSNPIYLIAGGMPEGLSLALPSPVMAGQEVKAEVHAQANTKLQTYSLTIYAAGGGENHSLSFGVTVLPEGTAAPEAPPVAVETSTEPPAEAVLPVNQDIGAHWVGTWGASAVTPSNESGAYYLTNVTVRQIAHLSIGSQNGLRIKLSNALGREAVTFGAVHVAQWAGNSQNVTSAIVPETDRVVTFGKAESVTIAAGAEMWSDPIALPLAAGADLAVSFFIPKTSNVPATMHTFGNQTAFFALGDAAASVTLPKAVTDTVRPYLTAVDVNAPEASAVVALGDSLTDGMLSAKDQNARWTDDLARRLQQAVADRVGVVNSGISGNCVVTSCWGPTMVSRFERDVLSVSGVKYLIVLAGVNDIGNALDLTAAQLTAAYQNMVTLAHAQSILVYGGTIPPFGGSSYFSAAHEKIRQEVNAFIRTSGVFDGVIEFDKALADAGNAAVLSAQYCGDKIRPNDAGYAAMAATVDLGLLGR